MPINNRWSNKEDQSKPAFLFSFQKVRISLCLLDATHNSARWQNVVPLSPQEPPVSGIVLGNWVSPLISRMEMVENQQGPFVPQEWLDSTGFIILKPQDF